MFARRRVGRKRVARALSDQAHTNQALADRALAERAFAGEEERVQATSQLQATTRGSAARRQLLLAQDKKKARAKVMAALALPVFKRSRRWPHSWSEKVLLATDRELLWSRSSRFGDKIFSRSSRMSDNGSATVTNADGHGIPLWQIVRVEAATPPSLEFVVSSHGSKAIRFRAFNIFARDSWVAHLQETFRADLR